MTTGDGIVFGFGISAVIGAIAWRLALLRWKKRHDALVSGYVQVRGVVTDNRVDGSGSDTDYYQIVTYEVSGTKYLFVNDSRSYTPWPIGKPFDVAYDPQQPSTAVEAKYDDAWDKKLIAVMAIAGILIAAEAWTGGIFT